MIPVNKEGKRKVEHETWKVRTDSAVDAGLIVSVAEVQKTNV